MLSKDLKYNAPKREYILMAISDVVNFHEDCFFCTPYMHQTNVLLNHFSKT